MPRLAVLLLLLWMPAGAAAQDNTACDAACPTPCFFGVCTPAKASYERALEQCDRDALQAVVTLYNGTASAQRAREALDRLRRFDTGRIKATPNACAPLRQQTQGPCARVTPRPGYRCEVEGDVAVLVPDAPVVVQPQATPSPPVIWQAPEAPEPARSATAIAQERYRCFEDGVQGVEFGGKCWPLGTTRITPFDISLETRQTITEAAPLAGLTGLTELSLWATSVTDIGALSGLTGLTVLDLSATSVTDIGALSGLTGLTELKLSVTSVRDIGALSGLIGLRELNLFGTPVRDIGALSSLTGLRKLSLWSTPITDIGVLSNLTALHRLWLPDDTHHGHGGADTYANRAAVQEAIRSWRPR